MLEAHLEGTGGQLSDPHGVDSRRPAHPVTVHRARCQPTGLSTGRAPPAAKLAQIWMESLERAINESDPKCRIQALRPCYEPESELVVRGGIEPPTPRFSGTRNDANRAKYGELSELAVAEVIVGWMDLDGGAAPAASLAGPMGGIQQGLSLGTDGLATYVSRPDQYA